MRAIIGTKLITNQIAQPATKPFEIYDARLPGFMLRVQPSGVRSYYARLSANHRIALGKVGELSPNEARERCQKVLGNIAHGRHPRYGLDGLHGVTLGQFVQDTYARWARANRPRTATNTLEKLQRHFGSWFSDPLCTITADRIESWKQRRLRGGCTATTVLRDLFTLSSVLSRAVRLGELADNPIRRVDKPRIDHRGKVRFLDEAEENRLRDALETRDVEMRRERVAASARADRASSLAPFRRSPNASGAAVDEHGSTTRRAPQTALVFGRFRSSAPDDRRREREVSADPSRPAECRSDEYARPLAGAIR